MQSVDATPAGSYFERATLAADMATLVDRLNDGEAVVRSAGVKDRVVVRRTDGLTVMA